MAVPREYGDEYIPQGLISMELARYFRQFSARSLLGSTGSTNGDKDCRVCICYESALITVSRSLLQTAKVTTALLLRVTSFHVISGVIQK
jgi:hypothetical protein